MPHIESADPAERMSSAPDGGLREWQVLPYLGVLRISGADAAGFLQGQLSNDTRRLTSGTPLLAALSTAQGRVVAVLHLLPHSSGILAILPVDLARATAERLRNYVLRAKVKIEDLSAQFLVAGRQVAQHSMETDGIAFARVGTARDRYWAVGDAAAVRALLGDPALGAQDAWRLADVRAGLPQIYAATSEMFVAQMLNLDLLDGISFTKGCFTGQEIIARTQHLGRIKRRMARLRLPAGAWAPGQAVQLTDGRSGRLTEVVPVGADHEALAVLSLESADAGGPPHTDSAVVAMVAAVELPLPYAVPPRSAPPDGLSG